MSFLDEVAAGGVKPGDFASQLAVALAAEATTIADAVAAGGVANYASGTTYGYGAFVVGSDHHTYVSVATANVGHNPTTDAGVHWHDVTAASSSTGDADWIVVGAGGGAPAYVLGFQGEIEAGGSAFRDLSFRKDGQGFVHLEGVTNGSGTDCFVLPTGYRPAGQIFDAVADSGGGFHRCDVKTDGTVTFPDTIVAQAIGFAAGTRSTRMAAKQRLCKHCRRLLNEMTWMCHHCDLRASEKKDAPIK